MTHSLTTGHAGRLIIRLIHSDKWLLKQEGGERLMGENQRLCRGERKIRFSLIHFLIWSPPSLHPFRLEMSQVKVTRVIETSKQFDVAYLSGLKKQNKKFSHIARRSQRETMGGSVQRERLPVKTLLFTV